MNNSKNFITSWELANDSSTNIFSDIESKIADEFANRIKEQIDDEILGTMLELSGWIKVNSFMCVPQEWLDENIKGEYRKLHSGWHFANKQDAEWFILRWL